MRPPWRRSCSPRPATGMGLRILLRLARNALTSGALRHAEELLRRASQDSSLIELEVFRVELLTATGRVAEALQVGAASLDTARGDQHAELCFALARAAVTAGRWSTADDFVARAGRTDDVRSLVLRADSAHGAGRVEEAHRLAELAGARGGCAPGRVRRGGLVVQGGVQQARH